MGMRGIDGRVFRLHQLRPASKAQYVSGASEVGVGRSVSAPQDEYQGGHQAMTGEVHPLDPIPDPTPIPRPSRVGLIWEGHQFSEIDPITGECIGVGNVEVEDSQNGET